MTERRISTVAAVQKGLESRIPAPGHMLGHLRAQLPGVRSLGLPGGSGQKFLVAWLGKSAHRVVLGLVNGSPGSDAVVQTSLGAGVYYLHVLGNGQNTTYELRLARSFTNDVPAFIITQPAGATITSGQAAVFSVLADGSGTLTPGQLGISSSKRPSGAGLRR